MKTSDRTIVFVVPLLALAIGFWFLVIAPKRSESDELSEQVVALEASIDAAEAEISAAETARDEFPRSYGQLVSLGRAVPEDSDQSTFIYDMAGLGQDNDVKFRDFVVSGGSAAAPAATPPPPPPPDDTSTGEDGAEPVPATPEAAPVAAAPAVATEASAATLPLGATVGPAGLPVVPYEFRFQGSFFDMADFFHDVDQTVVVSDKDGKPEVSGRLVTIDSFELTGDPNTGFPDVEANFAVTTYIVPAEQGLQAGATPAGPAPVSSPAAPTPISTASTP